MRIHDRQYEHVILGSVGLICALLGMIASFYPNIPTFLTIHSISGKLITYFPTYYKNFDVGR